MFEVDKYLFAAFEDDDDDVHSQDKTMALILKLNRFPCHIFDRVDLGIKSLFITNFAFT